MFKNETRLTEAALKTVQQYEVDVTLDRDTAHPYLTVSEDGKQVGLRRVQTDPPNNPKRFSNALCVLGNQRVSSGRFYFQVQVKGTADWGVGFARESVVRKGLFLFSPENGYWTLWLKKGTFCRAFADTRVDLTLKSKPEKVGVFVDYDERLVSFYDVDTADVIYTFTGCSFTGKLLPVLLPSANQWGEDSGPLTVCPVKTFGCLSF